MISGLILCVPENKLITKVEYILDYIEKTISNDVYTCANKVEAIELYSDLARSMENEYTDYIGRSVVILHNLMQDRE